jgi:hypothetical protein
MDHGRFNELIGFPQLSALEEKYLPSPEEFAAGKSLNGKD